MSAAAGGGNRDGGVVAGAMSGGGPGPRSAVEKPPALRRLACALLVVLLAGCVPIGVRVQNMLALQPAGHSSGEGESMPYQSIADLPKAQTDQYNRHQKEAFVKAFNNAYREYGGDESRAFAVAHAAAKRAGERPGPG